MIMVPQERELEHGVVQTLVCAGFSVVRRGARESQGWVLHPWIFSQSDHQQDHPASLKNTLEEENIVERVRCVPLPHLNKFSIRIGHSSELAKCWAELSTSCLSASQ